MIQHIKIENYKSIPALELELGRLNVFIGENGCGKTNILEAVALGSAVAEDKLDDEFLGNRGIRYVNPDAMVSGFSNKLLGKDIIITVNYHEFHISTQEKLLNNNSKGIFLKAQDQIARLDDLIESVKHFSIEFSNITKDINTLAKKVKKHQISTVDAELELKNYSLLLEEAKGNLSEQEKNYKNLVVKVAPIMKGLNDIENSGFAEFRLFCPENTHLRRFDEEGQIRPLGIRGEGLFSHLADLARNEPDTFKKINENLQIIDWVESFEIPNDLIFNERRIRIRDRYLDDGIQYIDQRSSNEGFLYLLFYITLFVSPHTPKFFAIDNIDNALNPRLCAKLIGELVRLAKAHDKQVIVTAHNPGLLDGLNLNDEEQRLFVISRNKLGHTKALRIEQKPSSNGHEPVKLSEQFLRGYIGGIPNI